MLYAKNVDALREKKSGKRQLKKIQTFSHVKKTLFAQGSAVTNYQHDVFVYVVVNF